MKFNPTTIKFLLEAASFDNLQLLVLKRQLSLQTFYEMIYFPPNFEGDTWKAMYYAEASEMQAKKKKEVT